MAVIELRDIEYRRDGRAILGGISWRIERGEHWALLGANGSGKTTLLKIVTGYDWPTQGTVEVLGRRYGACDLRELRKAVGWVSSSLEANLPGQDTAWEIAVSGFEASLGLYRRFSAEEMDRARAVLRMLGCEAVAEQAFGTLSQGEQQRVLIARALVNEPVLLILDEPCAGLDPAAREEFLGDLGQLAGREEAPTMILVTHHIDEIGPWVDQVLVLKEGRSLAMGAKAVSLTSEVLSEAFGRACEVEKNGSRCYLRLV